MLTGRAGVTVIKQIMFVRNFVIVQVIGSCSQRFKMRKEKWGLAKFPQNKSGTGTIFILVPIRRSMGMRIKILF